METENLQSIPIDLETLKSSNDFGLGTPSVTVEWKNLKYDVKVAGKKGERLEILHGLDGIVKPGQVMAILGGSGAGKSTLLDILANRKTTGKIHGEVTFNGFAAKDIPYFQDISGYVTQEDIFTPTLTVRENLRFMAALTIPRSVSKEERNERVEQVMKELHISHKADAKIGSTDSKGLSGGEKKRVSIAEQLLRDPKILFLDEPTSGLDSYNSLLVMQMMNRLAEKRQMVVIASIHQPRSTIFELFDKLLILQRGKTAYFGDAKDASQYFSSIGFELPLGYNPADFFIDVVLSEDKMDFPGAFEKSNRKPQFEEVHGDLPLPTPDMPSWLYKSGVLIHRFFLDQLRNPEAFFVNVIEMIVLGLLVGSTFYQLGLGPQDINGRVGLFFFSLLGGAFPITAFAVLLVLQRQVISRERASGVYGAFPYFIARSVIDVPIHILLPILFNGIVYWMAGLRADVGAFFIMLSISVLNCMVAGSLYTLIGALSPDALVANTMSFVVTVIFTLFAGFLVINIPDWWIWLEYISFLKYGFAAMMVNEFRGVPEGEPVLALFGLTNTEIWTNALALICQFIIYRGLAFVAIRFVNREKR